MPGSHPQSIAALPAPAAAAFPALVAGRGLRTLIEEDSDRLGAQAMRLMSLVEDLHENLDVLTGPMVVDENVIEASSTTAFQPTCREPSNSVLGRNAAALARIDRAIAKLECAVQRINER